LHFPSSLPSGEKIAWICFLNTGFPSQASSVAAISHAQIFIWRAASRNPSVWQVSESGYTSSVSPRKNCAIHQRILRRGGHASLPFTVNLANALSTACAIAVRFMSHRLAWAHSSVSVVL